MTAPGGNAGPGAGVGGLGVPAVPDTDTVRVTVILWTYNHAAYIAQAIEGVLMQEADFAFELLISDDRSSDGTLEILEQFAERHPGTIRVLVSAQNLNTNEVFSRALDAARGKYIATLDGDDFWTSSVKLRTQVHFMEEHTDCSLCFHQVAVLHPDGNFDPHPYTAHDQKPFATISDLWSANFIASCSAMIRRDALVPLPTWYRDAFFGDWPLYLLASRHGRIGYLSETLATYRYHGTGLWSRLTRVQQLEATLAFLRQVEAHFPRRLRGEIRHQVGEIGRSLLLAHLDAGSGRQARSLLRDPAVLRAVVRGVPPRGLPGLLRKAFAHED
jgi:glycosyltransferase involved in cell wall biosynthesis